MKLVVLSDLHVGTAANTRETLPRLERAIHRINTAHADADLVVFAGDLAQGGRHHQNYSAFRTATGQLVPPWTATLGPQDSRESFLEVLGPQFANRDGFVQSAHQLGAHRVIVLDTQDEGTEQSRPYASRDGALCAKRLAWLDAELNRANGAPVIVVLHHPLLPQGAPTGGWLLANPTPLVDRLVSYGNVRHVLSSHPQVTGNIPYRGTVFTTLAAPQALEPHPFQNQDPAQMAILTGSADTLSVRFDSFVEAQELTACA